MTGEEQRGEDGAGEGGRLERWIDSLGEDPAAG
jgi:hypothetical protein